MQLRLATPDDAIPLAALDRLCFGEGAWSLDQIRGSLSLPTTEGWVLEEGNILFGFVLIQRIGDEAEILTIGVHPEHQRQGWGAKLMQQVMEGAKTVFLEVAADNEPAQHLYKHLGFKPIGRRPGYYLRRGGNVDALTYRLENKG